MIMTRAEVSDLTGKRRADAQARVLDGLGIPYTTRPDGSVVVLRVVVERLLGGEATMQRREPMLMP